MAPRYTKLISQFGGFGGYLFFAGRFVVLPGDSNKTDGYLKRNPLRPPVLRLAGAWPQAKCLGALCTAARNGAGACFAQIPICFIASIPGKPSKTLYFWYFC